MHQIRSYSRRRIPPRVDLLEPCPVGNLYRAVVPLATDPGRPGCSALHSGNKDRVMIRLTLHVEWSLCPAQHGQAGQGLFHSRPSQPPAPAGVLPIVILCWLLAPHYSTHLIDDSSHLSRTPGRRHLSSHPLVRHKDPLPQASHLRVSALPTAALLCHPWRRVIYEARLLRPASEQTSRSGQPSPSHS